MTKLLYSLIAGFLLILSSVKATAQELPKVIDKWHEHEGTTYTQKSVEVGGHLYDVNLTIVDGEDYCVKIQSGDKIQVVYVSKEEWDLVGIDTVFTVKNYSLSDNNNWIVP